MAWDLFLGPAPEVPYHPVYHPGQWRGWVDWGQGALGDMGAHLVDHPFWALELGMPTTIETVSTPFNGACYPTATMTHYQFAARGSKPAVKLTWYDGGFKPPRPEELGETKLEEEGGVIYIGSKGKLMHDTYGANPRLLPQSLHESVGTPKQTLPRIATSHEMNWVEAAKGKTPGVAPVRVRRAADRGDAARHRLAARRDEDPLRRRQHAGHQLRRRPTSSSGATTARAGRCRSNAEPPGGRLRGRP